LHDYYENHATVGEIKDPKDPNFRIAHLWEPTTVRMERDYLKAWDIFDKEVEKIYPRLQKLVKESKGDVEG
jgi:hypothetical protein